MLLDVPQELKLSSLRSFGSGELYGGKLVRLVYVDEAGISSKVEEPFAVVSGVVVDADRQLLQLREALDEIVALHIPEVLRVGYVLHATEIFNGGKTLDRDQWPLPRRLAIADDLAKLPGKLKLPIVFGWVDKNDFSGTVGSDSTPRERNTDAHVNAYLRCAQRVDSWLRSETDNEHCLMVVEDNQEAREILRRVQNTFQDESRLQLTEEEKKFFPFRRIQEDPLFQAKRPSSALQLADFCAFAFKRYLMDPAGVRALRFWEPMAEQGIYHLPAQQH